MQNYLLTVVVKNELDEKARLVLLDSIKKQFGALKKEDLWGARSLAYPIKHSDKAFFAHFEFESEPDTILSLDRNIKLNEDVIRYLLTRVEVKKIKKIRAKAAAPTAEKVMDKEEVVEEKKDN